MNHMQFPGGSEGFFPGLLGVHPVEMERWEGRRPPYYGGRPRPPFGFGSPFLGGFVGGLLGSALFPPYFGYGYGYPFYGNPYYGGGFPYYY